MKILWIFILLVLFVAGGSVGLLYAKIIPAAPIAAASPIAAKALKMAGIYNSKAPKAVPGADKTASAAAAAPAVDPFAQEKQQIAAQQAQIAKERNDLLKQKAQPAFVANANAPLSPKLADIYDTMGPDDLAKIFAKQSDREVARALAAMDESKAGKAMGAMPPDRAAKIAAALGAPTPTQGTTRIASADTPAKPLSSIQ